MPWRPRWTPDYVIPDAYSVLNHTIGRLWDGSEMVGYVSFSLDRMARKVEGHLWWRRFEEFDIVNWMEVFQIDSPTPMMQDWFMPVDPELLHSINAGVWETASWKVYGDDPPGPDSPGEALTLRIELLEGVERDAAWAKFGEFRFNV